LPWSDVQKILRSISRTEAPGKRDYAIVLLLATYGLGAAEVLGIRLEDVGWQAGVLKVRRPKTNASIELPLLPAVAKALSAYLRWERPPARPVQHIFLRENMPYEPITSGAIRHRIRHWIQQIGALPHPAAHRLIAQFNAEASEYLRLPVQRKMIGILRHGLALETRKGTGYYKVAPGTKRVSARLPDEENSSHRYGFPGPCPCGPGSRYVNLLGPTGRRGNELHRDRCSGNHKPACPDRRQLYARLFTRACTRHQPAVADEYSSHRVVRLISI
jgi:hypothetical protein